MAETIKNIMDDVTTRNSPKEIFLYIRQSRIGLRYSDYSKVILSDVPFNLSDWAKILNLSIRTLERYKKERRKFDVSKSDRFLEIKRLIERGFEIFENQENFILWLNTRNISLKNHKPKDLLDTSFGIGLVKDELTRIEHGVIA